MKKIFFFAAAAAMMAACSETDQLALTQESQTQQDKGIQFSVYTNRAMTRAGQEKSLNTDALKQGDGIGVFAYHTNNSKYDERTSLPNFMYNQNVKYTGNGWTYEPVKYWPNEFGSNALSEDIDYVTFFAYAPYVAVDPTTGIPKVDLSEFDKEGSRFADDFAKYLGYKEGITEFKETEKYQSDADAKEALKMLYAKQIQDKNITSITRNGDKGDPIVRYVVDTNPQKSVDLLWGVAADDNFQGLADGQAQIKAGNCYLNLSKQIGVTDSIKWKFYHALAKLNVQIIAAADIATEGSNPYTPNSAENLQEATKIYLRSIDFTGFAMRGALNLHSEDAVSGYNKPNWMNYDGTDLTAGNVTFHDGLKNGKEGYTDNINTNENPRGLNPKLIEVPTTTTWADKQQGIPTTEYANLFAGAEAADDPIFVIPTNERMSITVVYDIETRDTLLSQNLSDGFTKGSCVTNKISQTLEGLKLEAGKAYTIKLVVGIESVKVTVDVEEWYDYEGGEQKVDLPYNPISANTSAVVNGEEFETLQAAIEAAEDGDVITLSDDYTIPGDKMELNLNGKKLTLDLGGNKLTGRTNLTNGELTIKNGTVENTTGQPLNVYGSATEATNYSVLNIEEDVTVNGKYGVCLFGPVLKATEGYGAVANIKGEITADNAVFVSGNLGNEQNKPENMNNIINISGKLTSTNDAAVALHGTATINILEGAEITGNTGIAVKRGVLNINGGTINATGVRNIPTEANYNGTELTGAGISITGTYAKYGSIAINLNGGSVTSANAPAIYQQMGDHADKVTVAGNGTTLTGVE